MELSYNDFKKTMKHFSKKLKKFDIFWYKSLSGLEEEIIINVYLHKSGDMYSYLKQCRKAYGDKEEERSLKLKYLKLKNKKDDKH